MTPPLTPDEASRLAKMLGRLGSDHDGEVLTAAAAVRRFLRERGLTWDDVLASQVAVPAAQAGVDALRQLGG